MSKITQCPTCDREVAPHVEERVVHRIVQTCECGTIGHTAWAGAATRTLRVHKVDADQPIICAWHAGRTPVDEAEVLKCEVCGAYLVCAYCAGCDKLYPDHDYEQVCPQVAPPARPYDPELEVLCQACWDEIEDEQPGPAAA